MMNPSSAPPSNSAMDLALALLAACSDPKGTKERLLAFTESQKKIDETLAQARKEAAGAREKADLAATSYEDAEKLQAENEAEAKRLAGVELRLAELERDLGERRKQLEVERADLAASLKAHGEEKAAHHAARTAAEKQMAAQYAELEKVQKALDRKVAAAKAIEAA